MGTVKEELARSKRRKPYDVGYVNSLFSLNSHGEDTEEFLEVIKLLPEREGQVLRLRYGIGALFPRTLREVGRIFNITPERVRQVEMRGIRKLRGMKELNFNAR